jgi:hypothetical protein
MDLEEIVATYISLRDKRAELKKRYTQRDDVLKAAMEAADAAALQKLEEIGAESVRTAAGTVFKDRKRSVTLADRETFLAYVKDGDRWDMAQVQANKSAVLECLDEQGTLPPGLNLYSELTIKIRRS